MTVTLRARQEHGRARVGTRRVRRRNGGVVRSSRDRPVRGRLLRVGGGRLRGGGGLRGAHCPNGRTRSHLVARSLAGTRSSQHFRPGRPTGLWSNVTLEPRKVSDAVAMSQPRCRCRPAELPGTRTPRCWTPLHAPSVSLYLRASGSAGCTRSCVARTRQYGALRTLPDGGASCVRASSR